MRKSITSTVIFFLLILAGFAGWSAPSDLEILRKKFIGELMQPSVSVTEALRLMNSLRADGTWPGINYTDTTKTGFQHGQHLSNLVALARAYKKNGSELNNNPKLGKAIFSALDYWLAHDFICENWWWNQIGTPTAMVNILLIMDNDLTPEQVSEILAIAGRAHLTASGARPSGDRIKIAGILAKRLLFQRDEVKFAEVIKVIEGEIQFSTGRGMQYDFSFHHRVDRVNNTLSYGTGYADAFAEWAANVAGTKYQFSEGPLKLLIDYYLDGICKTLAFGKFPDPGACNRDITREGDLRTWSTATPERLLSVTDYRKSELEEIVKIRKEGVSPPLSHATFFWQSEHFTFQRPEYFTSVRMFSTRNANMEEPYNGEGLMNHHRGDGTNYISVTGKEYVDLAPVFDWQKVPGTTVVQKPVLPPEKEIQKWGETDFVGAVNNGKNGAAGFDFKSPHDPLKAKKAWFFFDREYVCLGAGITSDAPMTVATTLNQCWLTGDVTLSTTEGRSVVSKGERMIDDVKWVLHDGIGYLFPEATSVYLSNQEATGNWYKVNRQSDSPKEEIRKDVFALWLDHGQKPRDGHYQYIIVPAVTEQQLEQKASALPVKIIANTISIQAVYHNQQNMYMGVFYASGELVLRGNNKISMEEPGLLMVKMEGDAIREITVEDPSRNLAKMHLTLTQKVSVDNDQVKAEWDENHQKSTVAITLPQTVYAGKSVSFTLNQEAVAQTILSPQRITEVKHPRILLLAGEEDAIWESIQASPEWGKMHKAIMAECDRINPLPPVERIQIGRRLLDKSREALRRIFQLSYAFRMTGEQKYLARAEKELLAVSGFTDWNPSHYLDVAEMTMGVAIGYDWLYEALPEASRKTIREAIVEKGLKPSKEEKYNSWLQAGHNWNQVCNAGMTFGALAVAEDYPELAVEMIGRSIQSIPKAMEGYNPDGAYPEGFNYWGYGTSFNVMFLSAVEKVFNDDFGLLDPPGFLKTGGFLQNMTGTTNLCFNWGDCGLRGDLNPAMFWIAVRNNDPSLLWVEKSYLSSENYDSFTRDRLLPAIMIWGKEVRMKKIKVPKANAWMGQGANPVAMMRTSWRDPEAIYLGFKAGSPSVNHGHMDIGSFIMESEGIRWASDFGMQEYESLESKGIAVFGRTQDAQRWSIFRLNNRVHNTLTIDDQLQQVKGYARIDKFSGARKFMYVQSDISSVYEGLAGSIRRGAAIVKGKYVVIRDEVTGGSKNSVVRWTMLTTATPEIQGNAIILTKDGKKLTLKVETNARVTMKTWSTAPGTTYDAPNPGTVLVGFEYSLQAGAKEHVEVLLIPGKTDASLIKFNKPLAAW